MICLLIAFFSYCAGALGGRKLSEEEGYFNDNRKPSGFDTMQIFVSPSVRFMYLPLTGSRIYRHTSSARNRSLFSLCTHETGAPSWILNFVCGFSICSCAARFLSFFNPKWRPLTAEKSSPGIYTTQAFSVHKFRRLGPVHVRTTTKNRVRPYKEIKKSESSDIILIIRNVI